MSHKATQWAISLRGLKPAAKIVLWHLCDRHNPDQGCFPTQDRLAYDAEVSRSGLNNILKDLEAAHLIRREQRVDRATNRQISTRYILGFEPEFGQTPSPNNGHGTDEKPSPNNDDSRVQNLDTNPVREPVKKKPKGFDGFEFSQVGWDRLLDIAGWPDPSVAPSWWRGQVAVDHVKGWMDAHGFSESEILTIAELARDGRKEPLEGPKGLDAAMKRAAKTKATGGAIKSTPDNNDPDARFIFAADWINSEKFIHPNSFTRQTIEICLERKLITPQRARDRGQL